MIHLERYYEYVAGYSVLLGLLYELNGFRQLAPPNESCYPCVNKQNQSALKRIGWDQAVQQNYNLIDKVNLRVEAKRSIHKTMHKSNTTSKILVLVQLSVGSGIARYNNI